MNEHPDYRSEIDAVVCADCPMRKLRDSSWDKFAYSVKPSILAAHIRDLRTEHQEWGEQLLRADDKPAVIDPEGYFVLDTRDSPAIRAGQRALYACLEHNAQQICPDSRG